MSIGSLVSLMDIKWGGTRSLRCMGILIDWRCRPQLLRETCHPVIAAPKYVASEEVRTSEEDLEDVHLQEMAQVRLRATQQYTRLEALTDPAEHTIYLSRRR